MQWLHSLLILQDVQSLLYMYICVLYICVQSTLTLSCFLNLVPICFRIKQATEAQRMSRGIALSFHDLGA